MVLSDSHFLQGCSKINVAREVVERMFGQGPKTSALVLYENMQLEKEFPAQPPLRGILYFNSDGQVTRGLLHP